MSTTTTNVLITGAGRGIGKGLTAAFLSRPNHTVIATIRNLSSSTADELKAFPTADGTKLLLTKIESTSDTDALDAIDAVKAAGIDHLDIVIANAGIVYYNERVEVVGLAGLRESFEVNTYGPVKLFQAVYPLLKAAASTRSPKFVAISTVIATTTDIQQVAGYNLPSYGASKAALNHFVRSAHYENEWLTAFGVHPGNVATDMGEGALEAYGEAANIGKITVDESVAGITKFIDEASRTSIEGTHGFLSYDGSKIAY
jgi:norsolorinic acid ketoreductase